MNHKNGIDPRGISCPEGLVSFEAAVSNWCGRSCLTVSSKRSLFDLRDAKEKSVGSSGFEDKVS